MIPTTWRQARPADLKPGAMVRSVRVGAAPQFEGELLGKRNDDGSWIIRSYSDGSRWVRDLRELLVPA